MQYYRLRAIMIWVAVYIIVVVGWYALTDYLFTPPPPPEQAPPQLLVPVAEDQDWIAGDRESALTLVVYCDFRAPECQQYYPVLKELRQQNKLRLVYRHYFTDLQGDPDLIFKASEAAGSQGHFWSMHDRIYESVEQWSTQDNPQEILLGLANDLSLAMEQFNNDLNSEDSKQKVLTDLYGGLSSAITQTPTFFLNGSLITLPTDLESLIKLIDQKKEELTLPVSSETTDPNQAGN